MRYSIIFWLLLNNIFANTLIDIFDQGNSFMEDKNYSAAVNSYKSAIQINPYQSKVFYNLGNAHFRLDSLGHAVWAYSKALKLSPRDKNIIYNLNITKDRLNLQFTYPKNYFLVSMLLKIRNNITFNELIFLSSFITACFFILNFINKINIFNFDEKFINLCLFLAVCLHSLSIDSYFLNKKEEAILIKNSINIFSEPFSSTGKVIAVVNEGTKIQLLNFQGSWSEVIVNNGEKGWIPSSSYLELNK